ncbi:MAG: response regulator [Candidatus Omnitrophica bacterium]|nr:response regulator [Candidatus Omnitrophota bacterium]
MSKRNSVLIIDDDAHLGETLKDILEEKGYHSRFTASGSEALGILSKESYETILLDIKMAPLNGLAIYRQIKQIRPQNVTIMMTGYAMQDTIKECLHEGARGILYKPISLDKIVIYIEALKCAMLILAIGMDGGGTKDLKEYLGAHNCWMSDVKDPDQAIRINQQIQHHFILLDPGLSMEDMLKTYASIIKLNPMTMGIFMVEGLGAKEDLLNKFFQEDPHVLICRPETPSAEILNRMHQMMKARG